MHDKVYKSTSTTLNYSHQTS